MNKRSLVVPLLLPLLAVLEGCCSQEPKDVLSTSPDLECQTGVEVGLDIAVWECVDQEHVVAYRRSTAFAGCSVLQVERVPCGQLTSFEQEHDGNACEGARPR